MAPASIHNTEGEERTEKVVAAIIQNERLKLTDSEGTQSYAIETLSLQRNALTFIGNSLRLFTNLKSLDLSRNKISHVEGLQYLEKLKYLSLYFNNFTQASRIIPLKSNACLEEIDLRLNPITRMSLYRTFMLQSFPDLKRIDERTVRDIERRRAIEVPTIDPTDLTVDPGSDYDNYDDFAYDVKVESVNNYESREEGAFNKTDAKTLIKQVSKEVYENEDIKYENDFDEDEFDDEDEDEDEEGSVGAALLEKDKDKEYSRRQVVTDANTLANANATLYRIKTTRVTFKENSPTATNSESGDANDAVADTELISPQDNELSNSTENTISENVPQGLEENMNAPRDVINEQPEQEQQDPLFIQGNDGDNTDITESINNMNLPRPRSSSKSSSTGGVRWRAEVAAYADAEENSDDNDVDGSSIDGRDLGPVDALLLKLSEIIHGMKSYPGSATAWREVVHDCRSLLSEIFSEREEEVRSQRNEILQLRAQNERQLEQLRARMQSMVQPRLEEADEDLNRLREERNSLKAELLARQNIERELKKRSENEKENNRINDTKLLREIESKYEACKTERDALASENAELLQRIQNNSGISMAHGETFTMLREAHEALVNSNKGLLMALEETKQRFQQEQSQWEQNFRLLKEHFSNEMSKQTTSE